MLDTEKMRVELRKLGGVLDADISASYEGGDTYKNSFEEYMRGHEFGLALEVICDYLAADGSKFIDSVKMTLIEELHNAMQIQDNCISRLESAWSQARPSPR